MRIMHSLIWVYITAQNYTFNILSVLEMGTLWLRKGELKVTITRPFQPKRKAGKVL